MITFIWSFMILHPNCNVFLDAGIDEEVTATYLSDVERNHQVQQPPTDVVEVPDVEVEASSTHHSEVHEGDRPLQQPPTAVNEVRAFEVEPLDTQQADAESNQPLQQPLTDVVEVPDVEVEPSSAHQFEVQEANQPLQQHLAVKSFYGTSRCGRQLKRRIREYSPPLVNAKKRKH